VFIVGDLGGGFEVLIVKEVGGFERYSMVSPVNNLTSRCKSLQT
jgi:hypothetical protein